MNNKIVFVKSNKSDLPILSEIAKNIIFKYYATFLDKNIVNGYIKSKQYEEEILGNIENCIIMKFEKTIIGFSIIIGNKIHLMMIDTKYQNNNYGTILLKYLEEILFQKYSIIELQSFANNTIANNFYNKNMWKKTEEINIDGIMFYKYKKNK